MASRSGKVGEAGPEEPAGAQVGLGCWAQEGRADGRWVWPHMDAGWLGRGVGSVHSPPGHRPCPSIASAYKGSRG